MKTMLLAFIALLFFGVRANAQFTKASLQASGLTCSMCSKAVKQALQEVHFVQKVEVDTKNQQYNLTFNQNSHVELDALSKAVQEAGFSIALFKVTADVPTLTIAKDKHIAIGKNYFHFLNGGGKQLSGQATFTIVDKSFVTGKAFKKHSSDSKMECLQTGKAGTCCQAAGISAQTRVYHVII